MLSKVKGHKEIRQLLVNLVETGRVGHAYLFSGPEGVGKAFTALQFLKLLSCPNAVDGEPCGRCHICQAMETLDFPDLHILGPGLISQQKKVTRIKIQDIRDLGGFINYPPLQGTYKMVLINDAHLMTLEAANALLKVLEEPPGQTIFVLVTALEGRLPITIRSRCTEVWFGPLNAEEVSEVLITRGIDREKTNILGKVAGGSVSVAMQLAQSDTREFRQEVLGLVLDVLKAKGQQRYGLVRQLIGVIPKNRKQLLFTLLESLSMDILNISMDPDARIVNEDLRDRLRKVAGRSYPIAFANRLIELDQKQVYNLSLQATMEGLLLGENR